jgi:hypothetical protein
MFLLRRAPLSSTKATWGLLQGLVASDLACLGGVAWRGVVVPKPYPRGFRDDVVRVVGNREFGVAIE